METPKPKGFDPSNEYTWDSDDYPKGPYPVEESDIPQHCGTCGIFLENPLTDYGEEEFKESFSEWPDDVQAYYKRN